MTERVILAAFATLGVCWVACSSSGYVATKKSVDEDDIRRVVHRIGNEQRKADLKGIVVLRDGIRLAEAYFNGASEHTLHDVRSLAKSITSALLGIAIDRKAVSSVDDPVHHYVPGFDGDRASLRVRDIVTMQSGLAADDTDPRSPGNEDRMDQAPDWVEFARRVPLARKPGDRYQYASLNAFLVGAVVESATNQPLDEFARTYLFGPLKIDRFMWRKDQAGHVAGQGNLQITARGVAAFGQLFLDGGRLAGRQLISRSWVDASLGSHVRIDDVDPFADAYGFMWYRTSMKIAGRELLVHFASGNGGNKAYIVPDERIVVAITSSAYNTPYGQSRSTEIFRRILTALVRCPEYTLHGQGGVDRSNRVLRCRPRRAFFRNFLGQRSPDSGLGNLSVAAISRMVWPFLRNDRALESNVAVILDGRPHRMSCALLVQLGHLPIILRYYYW